MLRRLGVGERDDPICLAGGEPLQPDEDAGGCGGEVASEDMAVGHVDDATHAGKARRLPTEEPGGV